MEHNTHTDFLFETSWEVCNKVGGIHTVLTSHAPTITSLCKDQLFFVGPDVWRQKNNKEFIEDRDLYSTWIKQANLDGLHIRIGRWNIASQPMVILIDYTSFFSQKDDILRTFWEQYKLDSITGQWDYIEPLVFGYAAGRVIEHFMRYNMLTSQRVLAHFHEWMTGSGVLYLKQQAPQVGTIFTTHATVMGRCIAGNGLPLYRDLKNFNIEHLSHQFNVRAKYSLERLAAHQADIFTSVSEITHTECQYLLGKSPDVITTNGFDRHLIPGESELSKLRSSSREKLLAVAQAVLNQALDPESRLLINSGRYEFKNKGIDLFIASLGEINRRGQLQKPVVAYLTIPAHSEGFRPEVQDRMAHAQFEKPLSQEYCTHVLHDSEHDAILSSLQQHGLLNRPEDMVKVIFVPCYLDGHDGIFDIPYYHLLCGFDASVFPSYYEPWGYTPMESIAFGIPTLTTSLAGFGLWVQSQVGTGSQGIKVLKRNDDNDTEVIGHIAQWIEVLCGMDKMAMEGLRAEVSGIIQNGFWEAFIGNYEQAYSLAIDKVESRSDTFVHIPIPFDYGLQKGHQGVQPDWKKVMIVSRFPERLSKLQSLANNLWWSWDVEAFDLFENINKPRWKSLEQNPIALLNSLNSDELQRLERDHDFLEQLDQVHGRFEAYMKAKDPKQTPKVAYFSMEYGMHESVKIYSGGLGILAGDYLKEASDSNYNMVGVGLLYRYGYFKQQISIHGEQIAQSIPQKFSLLPIQAVKDENGEWLKITISLPGRMLYAKIWQLNVGRIPLFLLDTDIEENSEMDRTVTHHLYGGDWENRLKQEILLGVGGVRALRKLHVGPDLFHCNEGHAAFINLERLKVMIEEEGKSFAVAKELVRSSCLFTTHTPVPAGHDAFSEDLMRTYVSHYPKRLGISWEEFMGLGRVNETDRNEKFSMSILATKLSQEVNGVSRIHGRVSREMFANLYSGFYPEELHMGYVTNGVHYKTWANKRWQRLHSQYFGSEFLNDLSNAELWQGIYKASDEELWDIRTELRLKLIDLVKTKLQSDMTLREENPNLILKICEQIKPKCLTIGFARRFATYKRAQLLFSNPERLKAIVNNPKFPVQFIFAGKAHPADKAGQDLIKLILNYSKQPEFQGKVIFLENYDVEIAKKLVQGVDIWMNTPTRPLEASGTSGEKAVMNGVLNLSVLDGWWAEGYQEKAGWALKEEQTYENNELQNTLDAETIYNLIENEIAPLFYHVNEKGIPSEWIDYIRRNFAEIAPHFTMKRQLDDYIRQYYQNQYERSSKLFDKDGRQAHDIAIWKLKVARVWDQLEVVEERLPDFSNAPLKLGDSFEAEIRINLKGLKPEDVGVELIYGQKVQDQVKELLGVQQLKHVKTEGDIASYHISFETSRSGVFDFAFRIFPNHPLLPHRQDFNLIKWA